MLDSQLPRPIACSSVLTPFEVHCRLGHPSLSSLKKLFPQFNHLSSLDCESCQFAKHHRLSSVPRINKRATSPFELVHSDVGPVQLYPSQVSSILLLLLMTILGSLGYI